MQDSVNTNLTFNALVPVTSPMHLCRMRRFFLREARKARNLTQEDLAERVGLSGGQLSRIEREESQPALDQIYDLAQELNIKPAELLTGEFDFLREPDPPQFTIDDVRDLISEAEDYIQSETIEFSPAERAAFYEYVMNSFAKHGGVNVGVLDIAATAVKK